MLDDSNIGDPRRTPPGNPLIASQVAAQHQGAMSLLRDCVQLQAGESLLLVEEDSTLGYYDHEVAESVAQTAQFLDARVDVLSVPGPEKFQQSPESFLEKLYGYDHVVFFSRIGDQIRFSNNSELPDITMAYTQGHEMLESSFGRACYPGMLKIKEAIDSSFSNASQVTVTCPLGTNLQGIPNWSNGELHDVTIKRFPMLVPSPVPCDGLEGSVVISRFLLGTGAHEYTPNTVLLDDDVEAEIRNNRIVRFNGSRRSCDVIERHYDHVASLFGVDPYCAHSWHAGIHPGCSYAEPAEKNLQRWSGAAFGNPRLLHVHTCGNYAPGEICWNIVDPTITVDGVVLWESGRLYPWRLDSCNELFGEHPQLESLFRNPYTDIGL